MIARIALEPFITDELDDRPSRLLIVMDALIQQAMGKALLDQVVQQVSAYFEGRYMVFVVTPALCQVSRELAAARQALMRPVEEEQPVTVPQCLKCLGAAKPAGHRGRHTTSRKAA